MDRTLPAPRRYRTSLLIGVNVFWLPLSMLFNSLPNLVLPVFVLRFIAPEEKATALGVLLFVGLAAGALIQPLAGVYSDRLQVISGAPWGRWGRRQPLIVVGTLLTLAGLAGFALAGNLLILGLAYAGVTVAAGIAQAGFQGLLPDLVPAPLRGSAAGLKGFLELLGSVLGFSVAGVLLRQGRPAGVLVAIGGVFVLGALLTLALVREGRRNRSAAPTATSEGAAAEAADPVTTLAQQAAERRLPAPEAGPAPQGRVFARVVVARFLFLLGVYGIGHFLLFFVHDRLDLANAAGATSLLFTALTLTTAVMAVGGGVVSDRIGRVPVLWAAGGISALGALALIPAASLPAICIGGVVMSVGSGLFASANWALTADLTPAGAGGRYFGVLALATGAASAGAGLLGVLVDHAGYTGLFLVAALAFGGSAALLPRTAPARVTRAAAPPAGANVR